VRTVTLTKTEYNEIVYPLVALLPSQSDAELRVAIAVLNKLEAVGAPNAESGTNPPLFVLMDDEAELRFEDAEAEHITRRLTEGMKRLQTFKARAIPDLKRRLSGEVGEAVP